MNNVPAALLEMDRAIETLGARGIELKTNINGRALDDPEFFAVFERAANHHQVPVWMHPIRPAAFSDYATEPKSRYEIWQVMGWPYETTAAMARMVFSGLFDRLPDLNIITHHCGGMVPFFAGRAETLWAQLGSRTTDEDYSGVLKRLSKPLIDYFKMFYGDTVLSGSASALRCGLDFFGPDHIVFASDCPFDPEGGPMFIREGIRSIEDLQLSEEVKRKIYFDNAQHLLGLGRGTAVNKRDLNTCVCRDWYLARALAHLWPLSFIIRRASTTADERSRFGARRHCRVDSPISTRCKSAISRRS